MRFFTCLCFFICLPGIKLLQANELIPQQMVVQLAAEVPAEQAASLPLHETLVFVKTLSPTRNMHLYNYHGSLSPGLALKEIRELELVAAVQLNDALEFRSTPNDPLFSRQWGLETIGLPKAWETTTGGVTARGDTIVLAIVDSGFDTDHEDMVGQIWVNYAEIPGNGKDDDDNGYVDDYHGWSFDTDSPVHLPDNHGQSVAGIAGAKGDNNKGVSGVNWDIKLMLLSVSTIADVISAYDYVITQRVLYNQSDGSSGAFIVATNASFGVNRNAFCSEFPLWGEMLEAMGQAGVLTAAGTSNRNADIDQVGDTPSACPSDFIVSTLNVNASGQKGTTSSYGKEGVDLGTPGDGSYTTKPFDLYGTFGQNSAAAPHLTGAIGLLYATPCLSFAEEALTKPAETALKVKAWILEGVKPNSNLAAITLTGGVLDVYQSMQLILGSCETNTGNLEIIDELPVQLFPNPARDVSVLRNFSSGEAQLDLEVFNEKGQLLLHKVVRGGTDFNLNLDNYQPGLYLVRVIDGSRTAIKKLIVLP